MIHSFLLGLVQGIAEFVPISSSAHLVILPYIFNWDWQGLTFDVALHTGSLLAIIIFFWRDWLAIFKMAVTGKQFAGANAHPRGANELTGESRTDHQKILQSQSEVTKYPKAFLWMIILATIPGVVAGYFLEDQAATIFRSPLVIACSLAVFGIIIWAVDKYSQKGNQLSTINYGIAFVIGLAQMLAIVPGVSRSGSTMAAGRLLNLNRPASAKFSFLLSTPIILGSALFEVRHLTAEMFNLNLLVAFLASFVFGLLSIKYLLKYLENKSFGIFAIYRLALALVVLGVYLAK